VLGVETTTLDASGGVVAVHDMGGVTLGQARAAAAGMVGEIDQVPPMVSAVQVGGRRLHQLARAGVEVEREPRRVTVHRFEVLPAGPGDRRQPDDPGDRAMVFGIEVDCSSGTYVRSLAADLGRALGGGAHLRRLQRTAVGPFTLARARPADDPELLAPAEAVRHLPAVVVDDEVTALVATGTRLVREGDRVAFAGEGPWAVQSVGGELLAVYEAAGERVKPTVVLVQPSRASG
jgi:tRNA pseudouridine55 synthase